MLGVLLRIGRYAPCGVLIFLVALAGAVPGGTVCAQPADDARIKAAIANVDALWGTFELSKSQADRLDQRIETLSNQVQGAEALGTDLDRLELGILLVAQRQYDTARPYLADSRAVARSGALALRVSLARFLSYAEAGETEMARQTAIDISSYGGAWAALPLPLQWRYLLHNVRVLSASRSDRQSEPQQRLREGFEAAIERLDAVVDRKVEPGDEVLFELINRASGLEPPESVDLVGRLAKINAKRAPTDGRLLVEAGGCSALISIALDAGQAQDASSHAARCDRMVSVRSLRAAHVRSFFKNLSDVEALPEGGLLNQIAPAYLLNRARVAQAQDQFSEAYGLLRQASALVHDHGTAAGPLTQQIYFDLGNVYFGLGAVVGAQRHLAEAAASAADPGWQLASLQALQQVLASIDDNLSVQRVLEVRKEQLEQSGGESPREHIDLLLQLAWIQIRLGNRVAAATSLAAAEERFPKIAVDAPDRGAFRSALDAARGIVEPQPAANGTNQAAQDIPGIATIWSQRLKLSAAMTAGAEAVLDVLGQWRMQASPSGDENVGIHGHWAYEQLWRSGHKADALQVGRWLVEYADSTDFGLTVVADRIRREITRALADEGLAAEALALADWALTRAGEAISPESFIDLTLAKHKALLHLDRADEARGLLGPLESAMRRMISVSWDRRKAVREINPEATTDEKPAGYSNMVRLVARTEGHREPIAKVDPLPDDVRPLIERLASLPSDKALLELAAFASQLSGAKRPDDAALALDKQLDLLERSPHRDEDDRLALMMEIGRLGVAENIIDRETPRKRLLDALRLSEGQEARKAVRIEALDCLAHIALAENALEVASGYFVQELSIPEWRWNRSTDEALRILDEASDTAAKIRSVEDLDMIANALHDLAVSADADERNATRDVLDKVDQRYGRLGLSHDRARPLALELYLLSKDREPNLRELRSTLSSIKSAGDVGLLEDIYSVGPWLSEVEGRLLGQTLSNPENEPVTRVVARYLEMRRRLPQNVSDTGGQLDDALLRLQTALENRVRELSTWQVNQVAESAIMLEQFYRSRGSADRANGLLEFALVLLRNGGNSPGDSVRRRLYATIAAQLLRQGDQIARARSVWGELIESITVRKVGPDQVRTLVIGVSRNLSTIRDVAKAADRASAYLEMVDLTVKALKRAYPDSPAMVRLDGDKIADLLVLNRNAQAIDAVRVLSRTLDRLGPDDDKQRAETVDVLNRASRAFQASFYLSVQRLGESADPAGLKSLAAIFETLPPPLQGQLGQTYVLLSGQAACTGRMTESEQYLAKGEAAFAAYANGPLPYLVELDLAWFRENVLEMKGETAQAIALLVRKIAEVETTIGANRLSDDEASAARNWVEKAQGRLASLFIAANDFPAAQEILGRVLDQRLGDPALRLHQLLKIAAALVAADQDKVADQFLQRILAERHMLKSAALPVLKDAYALKAYLLLRRGEFGPALRQLRDRRMVDAANLNVFAAAQRSEFDRRLYSWGLGAGVKLGRAGLRTSGQAFDPVTEAGAATLELSVLAQLDAKPREGPVREAVIDALQRISATQTAQTLHLTAVRQGGEEKGLARDLKAYLRSLTDWQDAVADSRDEQSDQMSAVASFSLPEFMGQDFSLLPPCVEEARSARLRARIQLGATFGARAANPISDAPDGSRALKLASETLRKKWPRAYEALDPRPLAFADAVGLLREDEAFVQFIVRDSRVLRVLLTRKDGVEIEETDVMRNGESLADIVQNLRLTLNPLTAAQTPFDVDRATHLGTRLFGTLEQRRGRIKRLYVVAGGALQSLPLHVLLLEQPKPAEARMYRALAWLDRSFSIVILPSLTTLASAKQARPSEQPHSPIRYWGVGGPTLTGTPATECGAAMQSSVLDAFGRVDPEKLRRYCEIDKTANVVYGAAVQLGLVPTSTTLIGDEARESTIKSMSRDGKLNGLDLLVFATHGLLASEAVAAANIREPALVFSPPVTASLEDDGLLTLQEIMDLELDVAWVVLTACNTAGGDGRPGAEPLSGLARAFAAAGARGLVVSHWSVDGDAAVDLTKRLLQIWRVEAVPMDKALGKAMEEMRTQTAGFRSAFNHPAFWAPFVVIGGRD